MSQWVESILYEKKNPCSIKHILRPKWLHHVVIIREDGRFDIRLWNSGTSVVRDKSRFVSSHKTAGDWSRKEVNLLGESMIDFTTRVGGFDVNQCFSLSKPVLLNRINKYGNGEGELYVKYEESDEHGILISKIDDCVIIQALISSGEELVVNDMAISMKYGPDSLTNKYGKPDILLHLGRGSSYKKNKSAIISDIIFVWGDSTTKYSIKLKCDISRKEQLLEIVVR